MSAIIQAIQDFFSFIGQILQLVVQLIKDLIYSITLLRNVVPNVPSYLAFLPPAIGAAFAAALTLIIVYKIIGRD